MTLTNAERQKAYRERKKAQTSGVTPITPIAPRNVVPLVTHNAPPTVTPSGHRSESYIAKNDWMAPWLTAYRNSGNVRASCQAAGVSRVEVYRTRKHDPEFDRLWREAEQDAHDLLAASARQQAMAGNTALTIYLLKVHGGPEWRNDQRHAVEYSLQERVQRVIELTGASEEEAREAVEAAQRQLNGG